MSFWDEGRGFDRDGMEIAPTGFDSGERCPNGFNDGGDHGHGYHRCLTDAYGIAVKNGFVGTEQEWLKSLKGETGLSAYDAAVKGGYQGTIEEFYVRLALEGTFSFWVGTAGEYNALSTEEMLADGVVHCILEE